MLRYDDYGQGLPVLLLHGFPLCRQMWQPQVEFLTVAGYRLICPDLPGFGESPLKAGAVSMSTYADAVISLLDELDIDKAVIGGMSMGGYVLLNLAERYPERLLGAMFILTRAAGDDAVGKEKRTMLSAAVSKGDCMLVPDTFSSILFAPDTAEKNPQLIAEVRKWMESASPSGTAGGLLAMRDREDFIAKLANIKLPSLVVGADCDLAVPLEHARILAQGLPDAELKIIPAAGHMANLEQPELFNRALQEFLVRLSDKR